MPHDTHFVGPDDIPEAVLLKNLALITVLRQSNCSFWVAADEQGSPEGTYMICCVLGPSYIADMQIALQTLMKKWDDEEEADE